MCLFLIKLMEIKKRFFDQEKKDFRHLAKVKFKEKNPLVSVIVPAYNEEEVIKDCIKTLEDQTYKNIEIIFVDDGSTDKTLKIVGEFKDVKIFKQNHKGPGNARNLGAKKSSGSILSFVDADMTFDKDFIRNLIKPIVNDGEIGSIDGVQIALNQDNIWSKCWGRYFVERKSEYGWVYRAMLKSEFEDMGGFDPKLGYADDRTFFIKYNARSKRVKDAICYHKNADSLKEVFRQSIWIDLDCEIRGPISPLFTEHFALALESHAKTDYPTYNSGVIAFRKNHPLLHKWGERSLQENKGRVYL